MAVVYRCEEISCRKKFPWNPQDGLPQFCPHCGHRPDMPDESVISLPAILSPRTRSIDASAKQYMDGSETRAQLAAQQLGVPESEMSDLKITNFVDSAREGELVTKPVDNDVTKHMQQTGFGGFAAPSADQARQLAAAAHSGPDAHAGARAMQTFQRRIYNL